tara:strand:- start:168 stop:641 length:474 start_codon:yes stop_codon:yes gene_type:complete
MKTIYFLLLVSANASFAAEDTLIGSWKFSTEIDLQEQSYIGIEISTLRSDSALTNEASNFRVRAKLESTSFFSRNRSIEGQCSMSEANPYGRFRPSRPSDSALNRLSRDNRYSCTFPELKFNILIDHDGQGILRHFEFRPYTIRSLTLTGKMGTPRF